MPRAAVPLKGRPLTVRLTPATEKWIAEEAAHSKRPRSVVMEGLLDEAIRTRRFPGIAFRGPAADRRAWVIGSSLDVWEIVEAYLALGAERFRQEADVTPEQVRLALRYYEQHGPEIDRAIAENALPEAEWQTRYPTLLAEGR